jgi:hypothetical protein
LIARKIKGDFGIRLARWRKVQGVPIHGDFAATDPEETAEIDDRCTHPPAMVDNHVDDTPHIFLGSAEDLAAENTLNFMIFEHRNRGRFRAAWRCMIGRLVRG